MRRPILGMLFALAACLTLSTTANAITLTNHVLIPHGVTRKDDLHRVVTWHVGLDSDHDGIWNGPDECAHQAGPRSNRGCKPPPPPPPAPVVAAPVQSVAPPAPTYSSVATSTAGGCVGMEAESGSAGYSAVSPTGYIGCYQISPEHFTTGSCSGLGTDPAGQDACAAIICQTEGAGAWTNPAGENPCGRLGG